MAGRIWTTEVVKKVLNMCHEGGFETNLNLSEGIAEAKDDDHVIVWAGKTGKNTWLARYDETYFEGDQEC